MPNYLTGADVSHYQSAIDWPTVVKSRAVDLAYAKSTQGTAYVDPQFAANWTGMAAAGMPGGAYHYADPAASAQDNAAHFLAVLDQAGGQRATNLPPVLDFETAGSLTPAQQATWIREWVNDVDAAIKDPADAPVDYGPLDLMESEIAAGLSHVRLWVARYGPKPTLAYTGWQYTDAGHVPGITGAVDLSRWSPAILPPADGPRAPTITWTPTGSGVRWIFTAPVAPDYTGWSQGTAPGTAPTFHTTGGYVQWDWHPDAVELVLTFFFGPAGTATAHYPAPAQTVAVPVATWAAIVAGASALDTATKAVGGG